MQPLKPRSQVHHEARVETEREGQRQQLITKLAAIGFTHIGQDDDYDVFEKRASELTEVPLKELESVRPVIGELPPEPQGRLLQECHIDHRN